MSDEGILQMTRKLWIAAGSIGAVGLVGALGITASEAQDITTPALSISIPAEEDQLADADQESKGQSLTPATEPAEIDGPGAVPISDSAMTTASAFSAYSALSAQSAVSADSSFSAASAESAFSAASAD